MEKIREQSGGYDVYPRPASLRGAQVILILWTMAICVRHMLYWTSAPLLNSSRPMAIFNDQTMIWLVVCAAVEILGLLLAAWNCRRGRGSTGSATRLVRIGCWIAVLAVLGAAAVKGFYMPWHGVRFEENRIASTLDAAWKIWSVLINAIVPAWVAITISHHTNDATTL